MSISPFDISKNILQKLPRLSDEVIESDFQPWMMNLIFSNDQQIAVLANVLNRDGFTKKMIYDCYYYGLPFTKRFIPYNSKKEKADREVKYIMDYFSCNQEHAKQYVNLISEDEKAEIVAYFENRGKKK